MAHLQRPMIPANSLRSMDKLEFIHKTLGHPHKVGKLSTWSAKAWKLHSCPTVNILLMAQIHSFTANLCIYQNDKNFQIYYSGGWKLGFSKTVGRKLYKSWNFWSTQSHMWLFNTSNFLNTDTPVKHTKLDGKIA